MAIGIILQLLLVFSLLIGCKRTTDKSNFMDKDYATVIKWGCSVIVMFSHIEIPEIYHILGDLHFVCVTLFFLFSGYGLTYQYRTLGRRNNIVKIRTVLKLLIPYLVVIIMKITLSIPIGNGGMYYMNVIMLFYIAFFLISSMVKNTTQYLTLLAIFNIAYVLATQFYLQQTTSLFGWGSQSLGFLFGALICVFKRQISTFLKDKTPVIIVSLTLVSLLTGIVYIKIRDISYVSNKEFVLRLILNFCVIGILFSLSTHFIIGNRFCIFMGNRCMYIFLLHGVVIGIIDKIYDMKSPEVYGVYMLLIVIVTLVASIGFSVIEENIQKICVKKC